MPDLDQIMRQESRERRGVERQGNQYKGKIATDAVDEASEVEVIVPDYSDRYRHGPCRFPLCNGPDSYPSRGDVCLVGFDEDDDPWIIVWYPE